MDIRLREHRRGRRSVPRHVLGLRGHFLEELGAHVLVGILQLDLFRDGDAVVRDRRRSEFLVKDDVSSPGSQRHPDGVRQLVHAALERVTRRGVELQLLCHGSLLLLASPAPFSGGAGRAESCVGTIPNRVLIMVTLYDAGLGAQPPSWGSRSLATCVAPCAWARPSVPPATRRTRLLAQLPPALASRFPAPLRPPGDSSRG